MKDCDAYSQISWCRNSQYHGSLLNSPLFNRFRLKMDLNESRTQLSCKSVFIAFIFSMICSFTLNQIVLGSQKPQ